MRNGDQSRENPTSLILEGLRKITEQGAKLSLKKNQFIEELAKKLPTHADPYIETQTGTSIDIYWEDKLMICLTDEETVSVSDFTSGNQQYEYFEEMNNKAIDHIVKCYGNLNL